MTKTPLNIIIDSEWQQYSLIVAALKINFPDQKKKTLSVSLHSHVTTSSAKKPALPGFGPKIIALLIPMGNEQGIFAFKIVLFPHEISFYFPN